MRIAIDIDSTLHHYWDVLSDAARSRFGIELPYEEQLDWGITRLRAEQFEACIDATHADHVISEGRPYPGAVDTVNAWHGDGHFIHITSHRRDSCYAATAQWLDSIGLHYDELYCSFDKVGRCRELSIDVLIDDSPENLRGAVEHGIVGATLTHPWNADVRDEEDIIAADDWPALREALAPVLAGDLTR